MVKRSRFFILQLIFLCFVWSIDASQGKKITLQLLDANGESLDKIGKNIPCVVRLTMQNISSAKDPNFIPGFQHAKVQKGNTSKSHTITMSGSQQMTTIDYVLVVDHEQEITFGPYSCDGVTSNSITCRVVGASGHVHKDKKSDLVMMKVHVPQKKYFVGQKVLVHIMLWHQKHEQFSDIGYDQLSCAGCKTGKSFATSSSGGVEKINDIEYIKQEYIVELYPQSAGTFSIPALQGYYIQNYQASSYSFWLPQPQQKVFYANPVEFKVDALPQVPSGKKVDYVGTLDGMMLQITSKSAQVGKAITATLWMQGDGNLEMIDYPELQLPDDIKVYPGNSKVNYVTNTMNMQRTFEYVLQCTQQGTFDFPVQEYMYFDVQKGKYKSIRFGEDISINVEPGLPGVESQKFEENASFEPGAQEELPLVLLESNSVKYSEVPHVVLVVLYWFALVIVFVTLVYKHLLSSRFSKKVYAVLLGLFFVWRMKKNTVHAIRNAWKQYIQSISKLLGVRLQTDDIYAFEVVKILGFSERNIESWKKFYSLVLEASYDSSGKNVDLVMLQNQSKQWIKIYRSLVWRKI